jgi:hypothetical protein
MTHSVTTSREHTAHARQGAHDFVR